MERNDFCCVVECKDELTNDVSVCFEEILDFVDGLPHSQFMGDRCFTARIDCSFGLLLALLILVDCCCPGLDPGDIMIATKAAFAVVKTTNAG